MNPEGYRSPGPCYPDDAGNGFEMVAKAPAKCRLGSARHQHRAGFGAAIIGTKPMHGKMSDIKHTNRVSFVVSLAVQATRYHSPTIDPVLCQKFWK